MNEQVKILWSEAAKSNFGDSWEGQTAFMSKFADWIVKECAELAKKKAFIIMQKAEEYAADKEEMINATNAAFHLEILEQEIGEHFGVKT